MREKIIYLLSAVAGDLLCRHWEWRNDREREQKCGAAYEAERHQRISDSRGPLGRGDIAGERCPSIVASTGASKSAIRLGDENH